MKKDKLKRRLLESIEKHKDEIVNLGDTIFTHPELGYKEFKTSKLMAQKLEDLGLDIQKELAITGIKATAKNKKEGPNIAVLGELDALTCFEHESSDPQTGAVHACGHHIQSAVMYGVANALVNSGVLDELDGNVTFFSIPAEEFVEIDYRSKLRLDGKIKYFGGKQELVSLGHFDDIDISLMMHAHSMPENKEISISATGNGFIGKNVKFIGEESHAGSAPEKGINALNAAMLAINNIHANRETFPDSERIRVHPILTKAGDIVNIVPADVQMETYVRGKSIDGIKDANKKVNRSLIAGANAVGADIEITEIPGYMPLLNYNEIDELIKENALMFIDEDQIIEKENFGGSTDFGDILHLMPGAHPFFAGVEGGLHTRDFKVIDKEIAYLLPVKVISLTIIDLLFEGASKAKKIIKNNKSKMTKEEYLKFLEESSKIIKA